MTSTRFVTLVAFVLGTAGMVMLSTGETLAMTIPGAMLVVGSAIALARSFWREGDRRGKREASATAKTVETMVSNTNAEIAEVSRKVDVFTRGVLEHMAQLELDQEANERQLRKRLDNSERLANKRRDSLVTQVSAILGLYQRFQPKAPFPPFGGWAIGGECAHLLVSLVLTKRPAWVVEAGSGLSTLLMAHALESLGEEGMIISLEHDKVWLDKSQAMLDEHGVGRRVRLVHAPLVDVSIGGEVFSWYDLSGADLPDSIDLLFIDGPPEATGPLARYPALPLLFERLTAGATVVLDDAAREGERAAVQRWQYELPGLEVRFHRDSKGTVEITNA